MDTETLIVRAKEKDPDAFAELIRQNVQSMYKVGRSILNNDEDVADAIQEAVLTAFERLDQLEEPRVFPAWLTRILVNKCYDVLRMKRRIIPVEVLPEEPVPDSRYGNIEWKEALSYLEEKYRLVLILYYIEGFKTKEIGQILDIPEATVRTRLARGRKQLFVMYQGEERRTV